MVSPEIEPAKVENTITTQKKALVVAIDGPAGAGKSTVAKRIADALGYLYIDTGAMYRAATWLVMRENVNLLDLEGIVRLVSGAKIELKLQEVQDGQSTRVLVNGEDVTREIRTQQVTRLVSPVSAVPGVRQHLVAQQQEMAERGGVVMDGRDIGTVVLPKADIKIFLTASPEIRAERRLKELNEMGEEAQYASLLAEIKDRDRQDSTRLVAPLRQAQDAIPINTDNLAVDQVVERILNLCRRQL
jgi:pantoate ligase/cytidylate kinase